MPLFDESLNKTTKSKQLDLHVRFWDNEAGQVLTRYMCSAFLGHCTAEDLLAKFQECASGLCMSRVEQVSMDGPSVNWKFHRLLSEKLEQESGNHLIDIGSCGLHIVHTAIKDGALASTWNIRKLLSSLYFLFKDSPDEKTLPR